ncbi:hypothetical protein [Paucibacter sp. B51]|uniref:hypothetical protein n=1 Tax=Paucibacter sp. B51 TaxID=2993315 RepID=UPI0022EBC2DA|nr:hypothetical protein [Paucibacter sp. B51]
MTANTHCPHCSGLVHQWFDAQAGLIVGVAVECQSCGATGRAVVRPPIPPALLDKGFSAEEMAALEAAGQAARTAMKPRQA